MSVEFDDWDQVMLFSAIQWAKKISKKDYIELTKRVKSFDKNRVVFSSKHFATLFK
jgi:hypothetical protein